MLSSFAERLARFRKDLDRELPLPTRLEAEYRRLTGSEEGGYASSFTTSQRAQKRTANLNQATAAAAIVVVSDGEDDSRPPDDSGFAGAAWEQDYLDKPRPATLDSVAACPLWHQKLRKEQQLEAKTTGPSACRSPGRQASIDEDFEGRNLIEERGPQSSITDDGSQPHEATHAFDAWQSPFEAGGDDHDHHLPPVAGPASSSATSSRLDTSAFAPSSASHPAGPPPSVTAAEARTRRLEATMAGIGASTLRRPPYPLEPGLADISDVDASNGTRLAATPISAQPIPLRRLPGTRAAAAPPPPITPAGFRLDHADQTAFTTPGDEDNDDSETDDEEDGQGQLKRQRRDGSPSAAAGGKANKAKRGGKGKQAAAPPRALVLGPKPPATTTTTTTAAASGAPASTMAAGPSTHAAVSRAVVTPHPSSDPPEAVRMQESMTASESETDDEDASVSGASGSKVADGGKPAPRAKRTTFSSSAAALPLPQKRPSSAFHSGRREPRGSAAAVASTATPGTSPLASAFRIEKSTASNRRSTAKAAEIDRMRSQEKRVGRREGDRVREGGEQQADSSRRSAPAVEAPTAASTSASIVINNGSTSRTSARGPPPPTGPALTTTTKRRVIPQKYPKWHSYAECVRDWTKWIVEERREFRSPAAVAVFAGMKVLLVTHPGMEGAAEAVNGSGEPWGPNVSSWVERVWKNGGRCVERYVEGETTHIVAIGVKEVPDARMCAEMMGLDPREGLAGLRGVKKVTQDWARESITKGMALDEEDPRWKLA